MISLFATILVLFIAAYGFLLVLGGGPQLANRLPCALGRAIFGVIQGILRGAIQLLLAALASVIQFVFDRPRR